MFKPELIKIVFDRLMADMLSSDPSRRTAVFDSGVNGIVLPAGPPSAENTSSIVEVANFSDMPPGPVNISIATACVRPAPLGAFNQPFFFAFKEIGANSLFIQNLVMPIRIMAGASFFNTVVNAPFVLSMGSIDGAPSQVVNLAWKITPSFANVVSSFYSHVSRRVVSIPSFSTIPSPTDFIFPSGSELTSNLSGPELCGFGWKPNKLFVVKEDETDSINVSVALPFGSPPDVDVYQLPVGVKSIEIDLDPSWGGAVRLTNNLVDPTAKVFLRWERTKDL